MFGASDPACLSRSTVFLTRDVFLVGCLVQSGLRLRSQHGPSSPFGSCRGTSYWTRSVLSPMCPVGGGLPLPVGRGVCRFILTGALA